jgi:signal transduction histidine kinase
MASKIAQQSPQQVAFANRVRQLAHPLTRAHSRITDIEMRRQSSLLAGLILMLAITTLLASVILTVTSANGIPSTVTVLIPNIAILFGLYFLNRNGYYRAAAYIFVAQAFFLIYGRFIVSQDLSFLFFTTMALILTAILMPPWVTTLVYIGSLFVQIVLIKLNPVATEMTNIGAFIVFLITSSMVMVFMNHRAGLEQERQAELQKANDALRASEAILEQRVIERTKELEIARNAAEQANQIKSQFLANMSHELRTPLNSILNFTAFVSDGIMGPVNEEQVEALQQSISSGRHLLALINDVLDITKIETGMMDLFIQETDLNESLNIVMSMAKGLVRDKPIKLVLDSDGKIPITFADKRRIRQIFLNIISNAIKFTRDGSVVVSARYRDGKLHFEVRDTGIGIAEEDQGLVFQSFKQAKHDMLDTPGTGLGMPLTKFFVEVHGGRIWFESTPGKGTTFYVELPILTEDQANQLMTQHRSTLPSP